MRQQLLAQETREELLEVWDQFLTEGLKWIVFSKPFKKDGIGKDGAIKVRVRPVMMKDGLMFQAEELSSQQVFHKNLNRREASSYLTGLIEAGFGQAEGESEEKKTVIMASKKGCVTIKVRKNAVPIKAPAMVAEHNRKKRYILEEGRPVDFLIDLGVMTKDGAVVSSRYDKFRQINRFLEIIGDVLPALDATRENVIVDFGCGKSYLTFAMYYYLSIMRGYKVRIIGLDLKRDVILQCSRLKESYGFSKLEFYQGDIAGYDGVSQADMVVTLHACDTATDYALEKAVKWGAKVILSVPCCQHELNKQMKNPAMEPVFHYGLIRERMAALYTDAIRAEILENQGYRTQILEFIDMEHTPKNILIRAVKQGGKKDNRKQIEELLQFLGTNQALARLLLPGWRDTECSFTEKQ